MDHVHDGMGQMLAQDYGVQLVKAQFSHWLLWTYTDLPQAKEAVEHGKFNVIVTTQLSIVLALHAPVLIMYVGSALVIHILSLYRFDELPCHLTQALCHGATTNHLVRMVERGRLQDTKILHPTPSDTTAQEWIENATRLDGVIPPPSIHIHPSTESPTLSSIYQKFRDTTTAVWLSLSEALTTIYLILQERSKFGIGTSGQRNVYFSKRMRFRNTSA